MSLFLKTYFKYYFLLFFISFSLVSVAQNDTTTSVTPSAEDAPPPPKHYYLFSPRVSVTVPHPMANTSFKKCFVGIYEISGGLNMYLDKGFFVGVTYKNGLLRITENKIANFEAGMEINNAAGKIGGDWYVGDKNKVIFSVALSAGENWTHFTGMRTKDPSKSPEINGYTTPYIEPEVNLFFLVESNFGIGATLSYSIFSQNFDPYQLALNDWAEFGANNSGATQYLSFGFGFYYSLVRKKK
jgi:hypothetical protein